MLFRSVLTAKELKWESIPADSASTEKQIFAILPHNLSFNCKLFVQNCLIYNPNQRANLRDLLSHPFLTVTNAPEKKYALEQIKRQINSLSISGSQQIKRFNKVSIADVVYNVSSIYLSGLGPIIQENPGSGRDEEQKQSQNLRFSSSVDSSGTIEVTARQQIVGKKTEEMTELEKQLAKEKEAMKKLIAGYPNIE